MFEVFGQILGNAVAVAVSVVPILALLLIMMSERARTNGPAFALGWIIGLFGFAFVLSMLNLEPSSSGPSKTTGWVSLVVGVLFLGIAWKNWTQRPAKGETPELPGWMSSIDDLSPAKAFGLAAFLGVVNGKNFGLIVVSAVTVSAAHLSTAQSLGVVAMFVGVGSVTIVVPVIFGLVGGESTIARMESARQFLTDHNHVIMMAIFGLMGASSCGKAIEILAG